MHIGAVPVPYDAYFRCTFPRIIDAVLHRVPVGAPVPATKYAEGRAATSGGAHKHVVSLQLADEPMLLEAIEGRLFGRPAGGKRSAGAIGAARDRPPSRACSV